MSNCSFTQSELWCVVKVRPAEPLEEFSIYCARLVFHKKKKIPLEIKVVTEHSSVLYQAIISSES